MLITVYDHTTPRFIEGFVDYFNRRNCIHYASDVFKDFNFSKELAINYAIKRAKYACTTLNVPISEHFVSVYRAIEDEVYVDWKLSSFAAYLTLLNGNPSDPLVASFQQKLLREKTITDIIIH
jgi:DNA-damage-inducible protein D